MSGTHNMGGNGEISFAHSRKINKIRHFLLRTPGDSDMIIRNMKGGDCHGNQGPHMSGLRVWKCSLFV